MLFPSLALVSLAATALALPAKLAPRAGSGWDEVETLEPDYSSLKDFIAPFHWAAGGSNQYHVDASCNATQRRLIGEGLAEAATLVKHARAHIRRFGNDTVFTEYFGVKADSNQVLGAYDRLIEGDKTGINFTCEDVADLCNSTYGGSSVTVPAHYILILTPNLPQSFQATLSPPPRTPLSFAIPTTWPNRTCKTSAPVARPWSRAQAS